MTVHGEAYAEGRASVAQSLHPYIEQRVRGERTTAVSEVRRFTLLLLGAHGCICASAGSIYNLYSGEMQHKYGYTQTQMSTMTTVSAVLSFLAFPLATVYDYYGPRPLFFIGMTAFPLGAALFALTLRDLLRASVLRFTLYMTCMSIGTSMFDVAALMTVLAIFPSSRGAVTAVMKTFIGLGAAIFGSLQVGFFEDDFAGFFVFLALYVLFIGALCAAWVRQPPYQLTGYDEAHLDFATKLLRMAQKRPYLEQVPPMRRFAVGFAIVALLIVVLPVQSGLLARRGLSRRTKLLFAWSTVGLVLLYGCIAAPVAWLDRGNEELRSRMQLDDGEEEEEEGGGEQDNNNNNIEEGGDDVVVGGGVVATTARRETAEPNSKSRRSIIRTSSSTSATNNNNNSNNNNNNESATLGSEARRVRRLRASLSARLTRTRGSIAEDAVFSWPFVDEEDEMAHIAPQYQTSFLQSLRTAQLWILLYSLFCIFGAQAVIVTNARFLYAAVAARPISTELAAWLTVLNGAGSAIGRLMMSVFEIYTQKRPPAQRIPFTVALFIPSVTMLLATLSLLLLSARPLLVLPFVLTALGNGFTAASVVLVMRTMYAKDIANHYCFMSLGYVVASLLLNRLLYGEWYTRQAAKQNSALCLGRQCIDVPMMVLTFLLCTSLGSNWLVHSRYKAYCAEVLARRERGQDEHQPLLGSR